MPNQILQMLIQKSPLTNFQLWMLREWQRNTTTQELNYYFKVSNALF